MTTFAKSTFNALSYAAFRPSYPPSLFKTILSYHSGPTTTLLDLGCGHGLISRYLSPTFKHVYATDPSSAMITQASSSTPKEKFSNVEFRQASAEDLGWIEDGTLDMVVAGQAAHWFDFSKVWPEVGRKLRKGGTVAFWGYKDNILVDYPKANKVFDYYIYGDEGMGPYWEQPGRQILRDLYRDIIPPEEELGDVERVTYEPGTEGKESGEGEVLMRGRLKLGEVEGYVRTFSSYHTWKDGNKGKTDIVDRMFEEMRVVEKEWEEAGEKWRDVEVESEWGSVILMARKK